MRGCVEFMLWGPYFVFVLRFCLKKSRTVDGGTKQMDALLLLGLMTVCLKYC